MKRVFPFLAVLILILTAAGVYGGVKDHDFIHFDDYPYVVDNPHLQEKGLKPFLWALTADLTEDSPHADYWQPVTFLSRVLDIRLFGMNASAHHLVNLFWHMVNTVLLFFLLRAATGSRIRSLLAALFFSLHPLQVEPVAWITARKDLLAAFFSILGMLFYVRANTPGRRGIPWPVWACFLLAAGSKSAYAVFPGLLLVFDFWPLRRILSPAPRDWTGPVREKIPMMIAAVFLMAMTYFQLSPEWQGSGWHGFEHIGANSFLSFTRLFVPAPLSIIHPESAATGHPTVLALLSYLLLIGVTLVCFLNRHRRYFLSGWAWYVLLTAPAMIGRPGDRYAYLAMAGVWIALLWGGYELFQLQESLSRRIAGFSFVVLVLSGFAIQAHRQNAFWKDDVSLFRHAAESVSGNKVAWLNLGAALGKHEDYEGAAEAFYEALAIDPNMVKAHVNLGYTLTQVARLLKQGAAVDVVTSDKKITSVLDSAHQHLMLALRLDPENARAYHNLGAYYEVSGFEDTAVNAYRKAVELDPGLEKARQDLARIEARLQAARH